MFVYRFNNNLNDVTVTSQRSSSKFFEVIFGRNKRQTGNSTSSNNSLIVTKSSSSVTYSWSSWQPQVVITCRDGVNATGNAACSAGDLQQTRRCETKVGTVGKSVADGKCGSGSTRNVSCSLKNVSSRFYNSCTVFGRLVALSRHENELYFSGQAAFIIITHFIQLCGKWSRWSNILTCKNATCKYGHMVLENNTRGRYRTRVCDNRFVSMAGLFMIFATNRDPHNADKRFNGVCMRFIMALT